MRYSSAAEPTIGLPISRRRLRVPYRTGWSGRSSCNRCQARSCTRRRSFLAKPTGGSPAGSTVSSGDCRSKGRARRTHRSDCQNSTTTRNMNTHVYDRVLVPIDGSAFAHVAFPRALRLSPREIVLTVVESAAHELARQVGIAPDLPSDVAQDGRAGGHSPSGRRTSRCGEWTPTARLRRAGTTGPTPRKTRAGDRWDGRRNGVRRRRDGDTWEDRIAPGTSWFGR